MKHTKLLKLTPEGNYRNLLQIPQFLVKITGKNTHFLLELKRILVLFDYSIVLTVFECYCNYLNIRLKSFSSWETWAICNQSTNQA